MKRILLTGTYCSKNKGDAAMRIAAIRAIREAVPDVAISVLSPYPSLDADVYDDCPVLKCSRRKPVQALDAISRSMLWNASNSLLNADLRQLAKSMELKAYFDADLIVDLSGDGLTEEYGTKCLLAHLIPIIIGLAFRKPVFVCAQTMGPFTKTSRIVRSILNRTTAITTRERLSLTHLRECGLDKVKAVETGDMAFLLPPSRPQRAREILQSEGIVLDSPVIGMSLTKLFGHKLQTDHHNSTVCDINSILAGTIDLLVKRLNARVLLISHVTGPGPERDDRNAARKVYEHCTHRESVNLLDGDYSPCDLKAIIGLMDMYIGMRMHSNIAALSQCVPTVAIACGPKFQGIMTQAGQGENVLSVPDLSIRTLFMMAERLWNSRQEARDQLEKTIPEVKALSARNIAIISEILKASRVA